MDPDLILHILEMMKEAAKMIEDREIKHNNGLRKRLEANGF